MKGIAALKRKGSLVGGESGQVRKPGGGRKRIEEVAPAVERELKKILNGTTAGDPMSYLKWTNKSTRTMAAELERKGHDISHVTALVNNVVSAGIIPRNLVSNMALNWSARP